MTKTFLFVLLFSIFSSISQAQKPTEADITSVMKKMWEQEKGPRKTVTINSIKLGTSEKSNYAQQLEGVPKNALITHAKIDWNLNTFYSNDIQVTRRITTAWVYKDQFNEWSVKNTGTVYPK